MLAHELRAPLAAIMQMIHSVSRSQDEQRRRHFLERMRVRIEDTLRMIENLLTLSRLEALSAPLRLEAEAGHDLLQEAVEMMEPRAEEKGLRLQSPGAPQQWWVRADHDQLLRVFTNLIDNAIKYTPSGGSIEVGVLLQPERVSVTVADNGIGMSAEDRQHLFERFFRVRSAATRGISGSGLGLSLCKRIVELHGGSIAVSSTPGQGTTFTVSLPRAPAPAPPA